MKVYQISNKYRDEMKPRFGIMRAREFLMKDMYSFDINVDEANKSYNQVSECYDKIFSRIGVPYVKGSFIKLYLCNFQININQFWVLRAVWVVIYPMNIII